MKTLITLFSPYLQLLPVSWVQVLGSLFVKTLYLHSFFNVKDRVSHPFRIIGNFVIKCSYMTGSKIVLN